jgi:hypothetical protein
MVQKQKDKCRCKINIFLLELFLKLLAKEFRTVRDKAWAVLN